MTGREKDPTTKQMKELTETVNILKAKLDAIISTATYIRDVIQNNFEPLENENESIDIDTSDADTVQEQERQKRKQALLQDWSASSTSQSNENKKVTNKGSKSKNQNVDTSCPKYLKKTLNTCLKTNSEIAKVGSSSAATSVSDSNSVVESTLSILPHLEYTTDDDIASTISEASKHSEISRCKYLTYSVTLKHVCNILSDQN